MTTLAARPTHITPAPDTPPLLSVRGLDVRFTGRRHVHAVHGLDLQISPGECVAIVGESGSGKSVTARTLVGLTGRGARVSADEFLIDGVDAQRLSESGWRRIRGRSIGLVLQDALSSLDPLRTVRREVGEVITNHRLVPRRQLRARVDEVLREVGFPDPETRAAQYPHQLSGGLRQRALIAAALAGGPRLLVADEPTTALDVTIQAQILRLLRQTCDEGTALLLISHDLAVVSSVADRVVVMKSGTVVESGPTERVLGDPRDDYTKLLLRAVPSAATRGRRLSEDDAPEQPQQRPAGDTGPVVLAADGVHKAFELPGGRRLVAVDGVSLTVRAGQKLGIVGESGSGKSTLARILLGLQAPDAGTVQVLDTDWDTARRQRLPEIRRAVQFVSQDPLGSFDPRFTVEEIIDEPLRGVLVGAERAARVREVLSLAHLDEDLLAVSPRELSGGQRQRVSIARALALRPAVLICDEPVSALDVSIQAQILDLLDDLNRRTGASLVFISHDLSVVHHLVDDVIVMQNGRIVESGLVTDVFAAPRQPYTQRLLDAVPKPVGRRAG
ncbi:MAG: ABC transporter ATP-binding protein [Propionibacterium sp.]